MTVKIRGGNISATIESIRGVWKKMEPNQPFAFHFLDETLDELYWREKRTGRLVLDFTLLAILIGGLGLFALASYAAQQRTKEIGVRKVLGAGPARITAMLCWDFLKTVLAAVVLAAPFAWWFMSRWLANYAYRIQIDPGLFFMTALTALGIALLTVGCQALNAACTDPVKALKYE
jgi:putative ABC transport system permease protein